MRPQISGNIIWVYYLSKWLLEIEKRSQRINICKFILLGLIFSQTCVAQINNNNDRKQLKDRIKLIARINFNDDIDLSYRNEIKILDDQLVSSFYENSSPKLVALFSENLKITDSTQIKELINKVHPLIKSKEYKLLDEYLSINSAIGQNASLFKSAIQDEDYQINYHVYSKETYISLLVCKGEINDLLVTCIYGKYNNRWKLDVFLIGPYKILEKTSIDLYKKAKVEYVNNDLFDAANDMLLCEQIARPAKDIFYYFKMPEIISFHKELTNAVNKKYPLPLTIIDLKSLPQIFNIKPVVLKEGIFPTIYYVTKINLRDTVALKAENEQIKKVIGRVFYGIDKNKKYIFFKAYNIIPDGKTPTENFGFMLKNNE